MIAGTIALSRYPHIVLSVFARNKFTDLEFLVDSGFDGEIALSYNQADAFELEIQDYIKVSYASGESEQELVAVGKIIWFGEERHVYVILSDDEEPAIGTRLLKGCVMTMNFINDALIIEKPA